MSSRRRSVIALVAVTLLALSGCELVEPEEDTAPDEGAGQQPDPPPDAEAGTAIPGIVNEVAPSVVAVFPEGGIGSGVIIDADGLVVTNAHVVGSLGEVDVQLATGVRMVAEVVATDPLSDLAVLRLDRQGLPAAAFAEELPAVGELAVAIGTPLGLENTVTAGIISGLNRAVPAGARTPQALVDLIQTDAPIAPGNSGGALVNADAEVVGINVAYAPPGQTGATAIGFAIPSATVVDVVAQLVETGEVAHAYLGAQLGSLTPQLIERFELDVEAGAVVLDVVPDGPADAAGMVPGDVITAVDGEPVRNVPDVLGELRRREPGDLMTVTVQREDGEAQIEVELSDRPERL